jgi:hypothetical protein
MLLKTVLLSIALPMCLASLAIDAHAPVSPAESFLDRSVTTNVSYLESLSEKQRQVFEYVLDSLDDNFSPPFLVGWSLFLVYLMVF